MQKMDLILFLQNEQISIRNTREIHGIDPNSKNKHSFNQLVFPVKYRKFNQFSHPMTHFPPKIKYFSTNLLMENVKKYENIGWVKEKKWNDSRVGIIIAWLQFRRQCQCQVPNGQRMK